MDAEYSIVDLAVDMRNLNKRIVHFSAIDSTNRFLLEENDLPGGTVVWADYQSAGRGRFNRSWQSPPGDALLFSILLREPYCAISLSVYPLLAAVGVYAGLRSVLPEDNALSVKWPNDILLNGKKVCGILAQSRMKGARCESLVVGIGLNVNQAKDFFQDNLKNASSIFLETSRQMDRFEILRRVLVEIDHLLTELSVSGRSVIMEKWSSACDSVGQMIVIHDGKETVSGYFRGVASDGAMRLETGSGMRTFYAGDVSVVKE